MMPLAVLFVADPELMLRNVRPPAPMAVLVTLSAVPAVVARVLPLPVTVTVPLFAAVNAAVAPVVLRATPPAKVTVVPTELVMLMPVLVPPAFTGPANVMVAPVALAMLTARCPLFWWIAPL